MSVGGRLRHALSATMKKETGDLVKFTMTLLTCTFIAYCLSMLFSFSIFSKHPKVHLSVLFSSFSDNVSGTLNRNLTISQLSQQNNVRLMTCIGETFFSNLFVSETFRCSFSCVLSFFTGKRWCPQCNEEKKICFHLGFTLD